MVTVSQKEFQRVKVIENAVSGRLSVSEAARLLQLSERQVQRLKRRFCPDSVAWVHRGNRGRPMPWAFCLQLCGGRLWSWPATSMPASTILIFWEKLRVVENLLVSRETVRRILRQIREAIERRKQLSARPVEAVQKLATKVATVA